MFLGIEIDGTELRLGVGGGDGNLLADWKRFDVDVDLDGEAVRRQMALAGKSLIDCHRVGAVGIGFGGSVDRDTGETIASRIRGWESFPLVKWCREHLGLPAALATDTEAAGLAEARFGAGRGKSNVFYVHVGSGVHGVLLLDGQFVGDKGSAAAEIGCLRFAFRRDPPHATVESLASGRAIASAARAAVARLAATGRRAAAAGGRSESPESDSWAELESSPRAAADLLRRCDGQVIRLSTGLLAEAAAEGNELACHAFRRACQALGWAIAQITTVLAPDVVVVGGGVSQSSQSVFFAPLCGEAFRHLSVPQRAKINIRLALLGEEAVVQGALALAASCPEAAAGEGRSPGENVLHRHQSPVREPGSRRPLLRETESDTNPKRKRGR